MSDPQQKLQSDNPNAPNIPHSLYIAEKGGLAGNFIGSILYGTREGSYLHSRLLVLIAFIPSILGAVIAVFLQCMAALFNPIHRRGEPIKWGLVSYTVVMFSIVTIGAGINLQNQSVSYIDNREFPGIKGMLPPGPLGYQLFTDPEALEIVPNLMLVLNNWLADGFLVSSLFDVAFTHPNAQCWPFQIGRAHV